ncbi:MAG: OmpA family protein [Saprospiraceae bacterium]|nr:OmpA family protein [Saprospiraceae bacterium]
MRTFRIKPIILFAVITVFMVSCVSQKKYKELQVKRDICDNLNAQLKDENQKLTTLTNEQSAKLELYEKEIKYLKRDTSDIGTAYRRISQNYDQLNKTYELLLRKNQELLSGNKEETKKILAELQSAQEGLLKREDELRKLEKEFAVKKKRIDQLSQQLAVAQANMKEKEIKLYELQSILNRKDSIVNALKEKVSEALLGFENNGLTIVQKNGKVYVSLDEKLLFASGSFTVSAKGTEALKKLSKVLETNKDINILIEGHTDNVPYKGAGNLQDNWDLSAKRATAIVRIIVENSKVDPGRLMAAGRSKYHPVDQADTPEARAKNRRTEIILTPKLDELFKILESN